MINPDNWNPNERAITHLRMLCLPVNVGLLLEIFSKLRFSCLLDHGVNSGEFHIKITVTVFAPSSLCIANSRGQLRDLALASSLVVGILRTFLKPHKPFCSSALLA
ncbi:hypothetical protein KC19_8G036500 [Ceratodon purpureus]|uniref:Uncharacterized protein n=1 Tax=Ceratodon purpureus TaxID=3225 RepID=A0A8T0GX76_CERPU|nr:hypothetical protein KC19_8G036500 [Ceratodon purpureus]